MAGIYIAPLSKALCNWCFSFTRSHTHSHTPTAIGCHARYRPARQMTAPEPSHPQESSMRACYRGGSAEPWARSKIPYVTAQGQCQSYFLSSSYPLEPREIRHVQPSDLKVTRVWNAITSCANVTVTERGVSAGGGGGGYQSKLAVTLVKSVWQLGGTQGCATQGCATQGCATQGCATQAPSYQTTGGFSAGLSNCPYEGHTLHVI